MARKVTMADFQALKEAHQRLGQGVQQGAELALNGQQIVIAAELHGKAEWAQRFTDDTMRSLTEMKHRLIGDFMGAAERFTGERPAPGETIESYMPRINAVLIDSSCRKLDAMMKRNGVTLVNE